MSFIYLGSTTDGWEWAVKDGEMHRRTIQGHKWEFFPLFNFLAGFQSSHKQSAVPHGTGERRKNIGTTG